MTTTNQLKQVALQLEDTLNSELGFSESKAILMGLSNINTTSSWQVASRHGDVYRLLSSPEALLTAKFNDAIAVVTCGWASPTDDLDVPPSLHPNRRRVRLCIVADNATRRVSVLRFEDAQHDNDAIVVEENEATGDLADAVSNLFTQAKDGGYL